jgi:hypothetical protein
MIGGVMAEITLAPFPFDQHELPAPKRGASAAATNARDARYRLRLSTALERERERLRFDEEMRRLGGYRRR